MSIKQLNCYIATCDDCGREYENGDYTPHWPSDVEAIDDAVNGADWWVSEDRKTLLCDQCRDKSHAFVPDKFDAEGCARCPHPAEEHGTDGGEPS